MQITPRIAPCLWFDSQAEEAAAFYVSVFKNSKITSVARYTAAGQATHKQRPGSAMTVAFELDGQPFTALNAGPLFKFNEAVSFQVSCSNQEEVDYYWDKLSKGGDPKAQQCGWLKDKYGLSWQITPRAMDEMLASKDKKKIAAVTAAFLKMKKFDIAKLKAVYEAA